MDGVISPDLWVCSDETKEFFEILTHDDRNSRYVVAEARDGQWLETSVLAPALGMADYASSRSSFYVTRNGFNGKRREANRCRQVNAMMFDIDCHDGNHEKVVPELLRRIIKLIQDDVLPEPNLLVSTGRGLQLYFVMDRSTPYRVKGGRHNERGLEFFHDIENGLSDLLASQICDVAGASVDTSVYDLARVGRIPGSYNAKSGTYCELINAHRRYYQLSQLKDYVRVRRLRHPLRRPRRRHCDDEGLMRSRLQAIERLQSFRGDRCVGSRENMCFVYYNTATQLYGAEEAFSLLKEFNRRFTIPLPESDMICIKRTVDSVTIMYGVHKGERGFYPLSAASVTDKLHLTSTEIAQVGFFAQTRRTRRDAAKRRTRERRAARDSKICELYAMGHDQKAVSVMTKCSVRTVKSVVKRTGTKKGNLTITRQKQREAMQAAQKAKSAKNRQTSWVVCLESAFVEKSSCLVSSVVDKAPHLCDGGCPSPTPLE